jgi:hypothetical protein
MDLSAFDPKDVLMLCGIAAAFAAFWFLGRIDNRKYPRRFEKLARTLAATLVREDEFDAWFDWTQDGRSFQVRHKLVSRSTGADTSSMWRIIVSTSLSKRWQYHDLQMRPLGRVGAWLAGKLAGNASSPARPGASDDLKSRYAVKEQGTLPSHWMTDSVPQAIGAIYDDLSLLELTEGAMLEACEGRLSLTIYQPDRLHAEAFKILITRLALLADELVAAARRTEDFIGARVGDE